MSKTDWASQQERGGRLAYWGMRSLLLCHRLGGRWLFSILLAPVLAWQFAFSSLARKSSQDYLQRLARFAPQLALRPSLALSWRHFWCFAQTMLDKLAIWNGRLAIRRLSHDGKEMMLERLAVSQGGILLTAHLGNSEIMQVLARDVPQLRLSVLVHTRHAQQFNRLLQEQQSAAHIRLLQVDEISPAIAMELAENVRAGEWLVIAADRTPVQQGNTSPRTLDVSLLGEQAALPLGPHLLTLLLQCPQVLALCLKQADGYHLVFETLQEAAAVPRRERDAWLQASAQRYATRLEHYCLQAPLQWFNFYPFWQTPARRP